MRCFALFLVNCDLEFLVSTDLSLTEAFWLAILAATTTLKQRNDNTDDR